MLDHMLVSFIEEKMALGNNMLMAIVDEDYGRNYRRIKD